MSIPTSLNLPLRVLEESAVTAIAGDSGLDLTRYLLISAAMVAMIGGLGWLFQKTMAGSVRSRAQKRSLRIIDVLPMGGKRKLAVVKIYDRTFVVGMGDKELSLISELDGEVPEHEELKPKGSQVKAIGLARAFEAVRQKVGIGVPKPQPKAGSALTEKSMAATLERVARRVATKRAEAAPTSKAKSNLGDGRGLLG